MDALFEESDSINEPFMIYKNTCKNFKQHWHYCTELLFIVKGSLVTEIEGKTFILNSGDLILIHPKQIHSYYPPKEQNPDQEILTYGIKFDNMILSNTIPGSPKLPILITTTTQNSVNTNYVSAQDIGDYPVKQYIEHCLWEIKHKEFGYDIKIASFISLIITNIVRIWMNHGLQFNTKTTFDQFSSKDFSILEYIDKHSAEPLNIEDLAKKCGMCYSNFAKQFKAQFGKTCKEYIEFVRICKADTFLLYTDKTLDFISQETGFTDASHFIRTYKKIRGITPKQRRMMQK